MAFNGTWLLALLATRGEKEHGGGPMENFYWPGLEVLYIAFAHATEAQT